MVIRYVVYSLCRVCTQEDDETTCVGEYLIELDQYSLRLAQYYKDVQMEYCKACQECGLEEENKDQNEAMNAEDEVDCTTCRDECLKIENLEENGFREAADYLKCQFLYDDDSIGDLYIGAICAESGSRITLGVFRDADCQDHEPSFNPNDFIFHEKGDTIKFSEATQRQMYKKCVPCANEENPVQFSSKEGCDLLYTIADKCEDNAASEHAGTCAIIGNIERGAYDETGNLRPVSMGPTFAPSPRIQPSSMASVVPSDKGMGPTFAPSPSIQPSSMPSGVPSGNGMGPTSAASPSIKPSSMPSDNAIGLTFAPSPTQQPSERRRDAPTGFHQDSPRPTVQSRPSNQTGNLPGDMPSDVPSDLPATYQAACRLYC